MSAPVAARLPSSEGPEVPHEVPLEAPGVHLGMRLQHRHDGVGEQRVPSAPRAVSTDPNVTCRTCRTSNWSSSGRQFGIREGGRVGRAGDRRATRGSWRGPRGTAPGRRRRWPGRGAAPCGDGPQRLEVARAGRLQVHQAAGVGRGDLVDAELVGPRVQAQLVGPQHARDGRVHADVGLEGREVADVVDALLEPPDEARRQADPADAEAASSLAT